MDISVSETYRSGQREITLDNISIKLSNAEVEELFKELDEELHYGETREDLIDELEIIKTERDEL